MRDKHVLARLFILLCRSIDHRGAPACFTENDTRCLRCGDILDSDSLHKSNRRRTARVNWTHLADDFR
jgi:hypothetical protein